MRFEPMSLAEFKTAAAGVAGDGSTASVTVFRYLPADLLTPVAAFLKLRDESRFSFLLESVEGGDQPGRYSFIGTRPAAIIKSFGPQTFVESCEGVILPSVAEEGDIFDVLERELSGGRAVVDASLPPLTSGAVGFMGYDTVRLFERLPNPPPDDRDLPDAAWGVFNTVVAFDHARQVIVLMTRVVITAGGSLENLFAQACETLERIAATLLDPTLPLPAPLQVDYHSLARSIDQQQFLIAVDRAKEHIRKGDIFQVVLSQRTDMPFKGDPFNLYRSLRQTNPSPYLFFLDVDGLAIIGSSPESLVRLQDGHVSTVPIAGTRPRGATREEDEQFESDLVSDPKELAEHVMLVDLGRNDIGRVSQPGSVAVKEFGTVARYSHVMHLVSKVTALLDDRFSAIEALKACFPAGTVSGAPKVRAMEIIDELETRKRGPYAGAVGYLDFSGNLDVCITIRTVVASRGLLHMQAGAGIVADSDPQREWDETENKLRALLSAAVTATRGFAPT